jgi:hypothetical protein
MLGATRNGVGRVFHSTGAAAEKAHSASVVAYKSVVWRNPCRHSRAQRQMRSRNCRRLMRPRDWGRRDSCRDGRGTWRRRPWIRSWSQLHGRRWRGRQDEDWMQALLRYFGRAAVERWLIVADRIGQLCSGLMTTRQNEGWSELYPDGLFDMTM